MTVRVAEIPNEPAVASPADWIGIADTIAAEMQYEASLHLSPDGLGVLTQQLHSLALAKNFSDRIGLSSPSVMQRKAEAIRQAAVHLRELLQDDATGVVRRVTDGAETLLSSLPEQAGDPGDDISHVLRWIGYEVPLARTNVLGNVSYTPLALLPHLRSQLRALEEAAQSEVDALQNAGRGVRTKDFRQIAIGQHLPNLYAELYPAGGKGTYDPVGGTLDGPLYRFVQLASEALGFGKTSPEAIQQAIRRERGSRLPK